MSATNDAYNISHSRAKPALLLLAMFVGGIAPLGYPWQQVRTDIPGATNPVSSIGSAIAWLTVDDVAPTVSAYLSNHGSNAWVGEYVTLNADVTGAPYPDLQWRFNGVELPGQTNRFLALNNLQTNQSGAYTIAASNSAGVCVSKPVTLTVRYQAPRVNEVYFNQGSSRALVENDVGIYANCSGSAPLSFQWWFNRIELPSQTNSILWLPQINTNQAGGYWLTAGNPAGVATSMVVFLEVQYQEPVFTLEPSSQTVVEGATVRLAGHTTAGPPATHALQFNGSILGAPHTYINSEGGFTLMDVTFADAGEYRVIASNSVGVATSRMATLKVIPAGPFDRWTQRNPLPQSQPLFSLAHDGNIWVAVGDQGALLTSTDGIAWTIQSRRVDTRLYDVTYGDGQFVAVGDGGIVLTSSDATNWVYRYAAPNAVFKGVTHGNGRYVVAGAIQGQTVFLTSVDGVAWQKTTVPSTLSELGVAFGNGVFVAVGSSAIARSTNGSDWTVVLSPLANELEGVAFLNRQFVALGDNGTMLASSGGQTWSPRSTGTTRRLLDVTFGNGTYAVTGVRGIILTSTDTIAWTPAASGTPDRLEAVGFANGLFVAAGENGTTITSRNATTWTKQNFGITRDFDSMAIAHGLLVVVGKGGSILTSTDGTHFKAQNAGVTYDLHGIGWGNGLWVAVGEPGIILTSSNAIQWTSRPLSTTSSLKGVNYGNGRWIVVGTEGTVVTSTQGKTWYATVTTPAYDLNDTAYGNGVYLIVGDGANNQNGSSFSSLDGLEWTRNINVSFNKNLRGVHYTNGIFLATANDLSLFTTANGVNWTNLFVPPNSSMNVGSYRGPLNLRGSLWAHGQWIVVGNAGAIFTSPDLGIWARRPTRTIENLHEAVYFNGRLVTIGNRGTVLQSESLPGELEPRRFLDGAGFELEVKGLNGRRYTLQATTDLVSWTNVLTFTNASEKTFITDSNAVSNPYRYYRLMEPFDD